MFFHLMTEVEMKEPSPSFQKGAGMVLRLVKDDFGADLLVFYEGGSDFDVLDEREVEERFAQAETRLIYWELHLSFPKLLAAKQITLDVICYSPDGTVFDVDQIQAELTEGSEKHWFSNGYGYDQPGLWDSGLYRVEYLIDGYRIKEGSFEVIRDQAFMDGIQVDSLLFYEGGYDSEPSKAERVYKTEFSRLQTQYIYWEVTLAYPQLMKNRLAKFRYIFFKPDGSILDSNFYAQELEAGTSTSYHSMGVGFEQPGDWEVGEYGLQIILDGVVLAEGFFEIEKDNTYLLPILKIESLQFFEGGEYSPTREDRNYGTLFSKETARYINWELELSYPVTQKRKQAKVEYRFEKDDGISIGQGEFFAYLEKGWNRSWIAKGTGSEDPGVWEAGTYHVEVTVDGKVSTKGKFQVE